MIHAYDEGCLQWMMECLGSMFDAAVILEGEDIDAFAEKFAESEVAKGIEMRSPMYLTGRSGTEMAMDILGHDIEPSKDIFRSDAYWVGYCVAYIQWWYDRRFAEIFDAFPCSLLQERYPIYHEMDITAVRDMVGESLVPEHVLVRLRKRLSMTQKDLSYLSGISLPTIRAYEQGRLDLCNASGYTLSALSRVFDVSIEDLLKGRSLVVPYGIQ